MTNTNIRQRSQQRMPQAPERYNQQDQDDLRRIFNDHYHQASNANAVPETGSAAFPPYLQCRATIVATSATQVTVQVDALLPTGLTGSPQVALITTTAPATVATRPSGAPLDGDFVASGAQWTFNLGDYATQGLGSAQFRAHLTGFTDDDDIIELANTSAKPALNVVATVTGQDSETVDVRVTVTDPYPQGANTLMLEVTVIENVGNFVDSSMATVTTSSTYLLSSGGFEDFTIERPNFGTGHGSVTWKVIDLASVRTPDLDTIIVTESLRDSLPIRLELKKLNYNAGTGNWELYFKTYTQNTNGSETEQHGTGFWGTSFDVLALIEEIGGTASPGWTAPTGTDSYNPATDFGWLVTFASTTSQMWAVSLDVGPHASGWRISLGIAAPNGGSSLNLIVPPATVIGFTGGGGGGAAWHEGAGAPSSGLGANGDFYLNGSNGDVYGPKASGSWGSVVCNIKGATGATGPAGSNGTNGTNGTNGSTWFTGSSSPSSGTGVNGDLYFETSNGNVWQKISGTWSIIANITGATGATGPNYPLTISSSTPSGSGSTGQFWVQI